jgi:hypothetical protein
MVNQLIASSLDVNAVTPAIEDLINQERAQMEANMILKNTPEYLEADYRISHLEMLKCLLIRCGAARAHQVG